MADSKYYYKLYKEEKSKVKNYEDYIDDLDKIRSNLTDDMYDEIRNVNNELDDLMEDLKNGVRYDPIYTQNANNFGNKKEKTTSADGQLSTAINEINEEISSLNGKKNTAVQNRDYYKRKCKEKLEEEGKPSWFYIF